MGLKRHVPEMVLVIIAQVVTLALFMASQIDDTGMWWGEYEGGADGVDSRYINPYKAKTGDTTIDLTTQFGASKEDAICDGDKLGGETSYKCCPHYQALPGLMITATVVTFVTIVAYVFYGYGLVYRALQWNCWSRMFGSDSTKRHIERAFVFLMPALACILSLSAILVVAIGMKEPDCGDSGETFPKSQDIELQGGFWLAVGGCALSGIVTILLAFRMYMKEDITQVGGSSFAASPTNAPNAFQNAKASSLHF